MTEKKIALTEEQLVKGLREKDTNTIVALYNQYAGAILGILVRQTGCHDAETEQALQRVFIKAWTGADQYDQKKDGRLFTWMVRFARKEFTAEVSEKFLGNQLSINEEYPHVKEIMENAHVTPLQEQAVNMVFMDGQTYKTAAEALHISVKEFSQEVHQGIKKLRKVFTSDDNSEENRPSNNGSLNFEM